MFESQAEVVKTSYPCVLGDIGGTNARFGWQEKPGAPITHVEVLPCADHPSLEAAIRTYLSHQGLPQAAAGAFGIANPVTGDALGMTNHRCSWAGSVWFSSTTSQHWPWLCRCYQTKTSVKSALAKPQPQRRWG